MTFQSLANLGKFVLVSTLTIAAATAHADGWRWRTGYAALPTASLDINGQHIDDTVTNSYSVVTNWRNNLYSGFQSRLNALITPEAQKIEGYQSHSVAIKGPIQLGLTPNAAGPVASLSGFSLVITLNAKKSFGPITASCNVTVNSGAINVAGNLDVVNGNLTNLHIIGLNPSTSRDCSSNVSWIPVLGSLVDSIANSKVDGILSKGMTAVLGAAHQTFDPVKFVGLNSAIPAGRYVVKELNFDAGQYVVNNLAYLVANTPVSARFSEPLPTLYAPSTPVDPASTRRYVQRDEAFSISFPSAPYGGIRFAVQDNTWFNSYWECKPIKPVCAPPNTQ